MVIEFLDFYHGYNVALGLSHSAQGAKLAPLVLFEFVESGWMEFCVAMKIVDLLIRPIEIRARL